MRNLLLLIVVIGTLSFTLSKEVTRNVGKANIAAGNTSPKFIFKNINNHSIHIDDFKGKYIYINIWTTWSQPSKDELPYLQEFIKQYGNAITFVNLSVDYQREKNTWKEFIKTEKLAGVHLISDKDWQAEFIKAYNIVKIPRAILIDKQGNIIDAYAPIPSQKSQLSKLFNSLLK